LALVEVKEAGIRIAYHMQEMGLR
jgi:hypothetical protein